MKPSIPPASLSNFRAFAGLGDDEIAAIVRHCSQQSFPAGARIITEGDTGHTMHVLLSGRAEVRSGGEHLADLREGDFFGEVALVDDGPRSADVIAVSECTVLTLTRMTLGLLAAERPEVAIHILAAIGRSLVEKLRGDDARFRRLILAGCDASRA